MDGPAFFRYPHQGVPVRGGPAIGSLYTIHFFAGEVDYTVPGEAHPFWELVYMDMGGIEVFTDKKRFVLEENTLTLLAPDVPHGFARHGEAPYSMLILSFDCAWEGMGAFADERVFAASSGAKRMLGAIVRTARRHFLYPLDRISSNQMQLKKGASPLCFQEIRRLEELLLLSLAQEDRQERFLLPEDGALGVHPSVLKALKALRAHVDGPLSLPALCRQAGLSPSHLQKLFKRDVGASIMQYHRGLRIAKAKYLIRQERYTMSEVAEMTGFSSVHHFSTCFKQAEKQSPTAYAATVKKWLDGISEE